MTNEEIVIKVKEHLMGRFAILKQYEINKQSGKLRAGSGAAVEDMIDLIWNALASKYPEVNSRIAVGRLTPVAVIDEDGEEITESVDRHCFIDGKMVAAIECKTYLDKCYMQRANDDFKLMKTQIPDLQGVIVSLEDSIAANSFDFIMNKGNINKNFFLAVGKRNSAVECRIYNTGYRIQDDRILALVNYLEGYFNGDYRIF